MTRSDLLASKLLSAYRAANPRSRAVSIVKIIRNGSSVKQYGCVLCDEAGPMFCARYPETKASITWARDHIAAHIDAALAKHVDSLYPWRTVAADADAEGRHAEASAIRMGEVS